MNYLGIDYGEKRIGLSCGDSDVRLAVPVAAAVEPAFTARMEHIAEEIRTRRIGELVVGYPYNMDGSVGFKAKEVDAFIEKLVAQFALPVHRTDERLTSSDAQARMNEAARGNRSRGKQSIRAKLAERKSGVLDSRAATLILQDYLDSLPGADLALFDDGDDPFAEDGFSAEGGFAPYADDADCAFGEDGVFTADDGFAEDTRFAAKDRFDADKNFAEDDRVAKGADFGGFSDDGFDERAGNLGNDGDSCDDGNDGDDGDDERGGSDGHRRRNGGNHRRKGDRRR